MPEEVKYTLSLNDLLTKKLETANVAAQGLERSMSGIGTKLLTLGAALVSVEFFKGSIEAFNAADQKAAQLTATLKSTANAANLNREALDAQALSLMKQSLFDDDAITGAQALLGTFTSIHDTIFMQAIPAITDMATKMGGDLQGATLQVGKALQDPIKGITALRRVGVAFNDQQQATIKHLVETNHLAEAQTMILKELTTEFGGSAKAAAEAGTGPFVVLQHEFENVREEVGRMLVQLGTQFLPTLEKGVQLFGSLVTWIGNNTTAIKALAIGLGTAWTAYKVIGGATAIVNALTASSVALAAAGTGAAAGTTAMATSASGLTAALGPLAIALGLIVALYSQVAGGAITAADAMNGMTQGQKDANARNIRKEYETTVKTEKLYYHLKDDKTAGEWAYADIQNRLLQQKDANDKVVASLGGYGQLSNHLPGYLQAIAENSNIQNKLDELENIHKGSNPLAKAPLNATTPKAKSASSVSGPRVVNISITIGNLVNDFKVVCSNTDEGARQIKENVSRALMSVVNETQLNIGGTN